MRNAFSTLIEESIKLELNVADLYLLFHKLFSEDTDFWLELSLEEKNHSALLRTGEELFLPLGKFPHRFIEDRLHALVDINSKVKSLINKYEANPPSREEAFNIALSIENSAGELHFQRFMDKKANSKIDEIFQQLNKHDKDHANRISSYMKRNGIHLQSEKAFELTLVF